MCHKLLSIVLIAFYLCLSSCGDTTPADKEQLQAEYYILGFRKQFDEKPASEQEEIKKTVAECVAQLNDVLTHSEEYRNAKLARIDSLKNISAVDPTRKYGLLKQLYEEYSHLSFDSTFVVAHDMLKLAQASGNPDTIADARIMMSKMYISGGYFREADHAINELDTAGLSKEMKLKWMVARFSLEFENGFFFGWRFFDPDEAEVNMSRLYDEIVPMLTDDSYEMYQIKTARAFSRHEFNEGENYGGILLMKTPKNTMDYVAALGNIGYNKMGHGDYIGGMKAMTESAIEGIKAGSNNYSSLRKIAELVYATGDVETASRFIGIAMHNAMGYNSKYRIIESAKGYPMIVRTLQRNEKKNQQTLQIIVVVMCLVIITLICAGIYIQKQRRKAHEQADRIERRNRQIEEKNREIEKQKKEIEEFNLIFKENHIIAGQLMGRMIAANAQSTAQLDKLRKDAKLKLKTNHPEGIIDSIDACRKEIDNIYPDIDESLLAYLPNFAQQFNDIFPDENKYELTNPRKLPTEMRIFALWRIGVKKNEDIAACLGYSLNTIKTYKTKIIAASKLKKEDFYDRVMQIALDNE